MKSKLQLGRHAFGVAAIAFGVIAFVCGMTSCGIESYPAFQDDPKAASTETIP
jgi:hypothetical protein